MEIHPSADIATVLHRWNVSPTSAAAAAARAMFNSIDDFNAFLEIAESTGSNVSHNRPYMLVTAQGLISATRTDGYKKGTEVRRAAAYIGILQDFSHSSTQLTAVEKKRGYQAFTGDIDYALGAFSGGYHSNEIYLIFPIVERYRLAGVPANYVRALQVSDDTRFWDEREGSTLYGAGVPGRYATRLQGFATGEIVLMHEIGVEAGYASRVARAQRQTSVVDATAICLLWREGVDESYALTGTRSGLSAEAVLQYNDADIPMDYMVAGQ
jgi:hypothetical protein